MRIVQIGNQLLHRIFQLRRPAELDQHMSESKIIGHGSQIVRRNRFRPGVPGERHQLGFIDSRVNEGWGPTKVLGLERGGYNKENRCKNAHRPKGSKYYLKITLKHTSH
jgi:hypothetical protein